MSFGFWNFTFVLLNVMVKVMNIKKQIYNLDGKLVKIIKRIGRLAEEKKIRAFLVGGFVRDIFLNIKNFDVDIVVERDGISFAHQLSRVLKLEITTHRRFGTAVLFCPGLKIDITTFRKETYSYPGSLPVVSGGSLMDDLARRDFTINAMAVSINRDDFGLLFDYFCGLDDLKFRRLRPMHRDSFFDDPLRILRIARFKARFGFSIEPEAMRLIKQAGKTKALEKMQKHRVRDELILIFKEDLIKCFGIPL